MRQEKNDPRSAGHPVVVRLTHWINVFAMVCMVMSGMGIYNAHPILPFRFPEEMTLGGWLGGSTAWHFAVMCLFVGNGVVYLAFGTATNYLRKRMLTLRLGDLLRDLGLALTFDLRHEAHGYNAIQKVMYLGVLLLGVLMVGSGLVLWKPIQFGLLTALLGGFDSARIVHFTGMTALLGFLVIHVAMVALVPKTLLSMTVGARLLKRRKEKSDGGAA
ncbi:cytochrome b/b6 domain-containing protein [Rhizobium laguerreae]|uniref:cytochrome b/b6 domain-containing protein n=1 Tax=Rhizobium laguerreae TaxID=1076926 RepID=UPI001C9154BB|nr:cytochrome b/b6 domain-containing protein [Rhizobium laguerreae]MBY3298746.1 cytochrome b/b6 domain-containing protein [Rhizobium laguerreae]